MDVVLCGRVDGATESGFVDAWWNAGTPAREGFSALFQLMCVRASWTYSNRYEGPADIRFTPLSAPDTASRGVIVMFQVDRPIKGLGATAAKRLASGNSRNSRAHKANAGGKKKSAPAKKEAAGVLLGSSPRKRGSNFSEMGARQWRAVNRLPAGKPLSSTAGGPHLPE